MTGKKKDDLTWTPGEERLADLLAMRHWEPKHAEEFFGIDEAQLAVMVAASYLPQPIMTGQGMRVKHLRAFYRVDQVILYMNRAVDAAA